MGVTNSLIQQVRTLQTELDNLEKRRTTMENAYRQSVQSSVSAANRNLQAADKQRQQKITNLIQAVDLPLRQLDDYISAIVSYEGKLPRDIKKKGKVSHPVTAAQVDFQSLDGMLPKISDPTLWGTIKRIVKIDGYASHGEMVSAYLQKLEQGRQYVQEERQRIKQHQAQGKKSIEDGYQQECQIIKKKSQNEESIAKQKRDQDMKQLDRDITGFLQSGKIPGLINRLKTEYDTLGVRKENWMNYTPMKVSAPELMIGNMRVPMTIPAMLEKQVSVLLSPFYIGNSMKVPLAAGLAKPIKVMALYGDQQKPQIVSGFQSILFRMIRSMPPESFKLTFIDPADRGTNLGRLQKLAGGVALCEKPAASREDITAQLKTIEREVDEMSLKLAVIGDIYEYNRTHDSKMEYNIVIIHDFPQGFDRESLESLNVLVHNAQKCGISIIVSMKKDMLAEPVVEAFLNKYGKQFLAIEEDGGSLVVNHEGEKYLFAFSNSNMVGDVFIDQVKQHYEQGQAIDNSFQRLYDLSKPTQQKDSSEKLVIPFAVNRKNQIAEMELGGSSTAHLMLSGTIGSGKSTVLHALIAGIIMNYHPDDVELWLVDYKKVEFAEYQLNTPPHVKVIGLDKSEEFTFSLLEHLKAEFENRMQLFASEHVQNITAYKKLHGAGSLPRIVLVIDEFHNLTQAIQKDPDYMTIFENALLEYRALGLSCILADQAVSDGLRGLTEKGRKQLSNRIAMKNAIQEVRETLAIDNSFYTESLLGKIRTLSTGDLIFKKELIGNDGEMQILLDKYKALYITQEDRSKMMPYLQSHLAGSFTPKNIIFVDGQKRSNFDQSAIVEFEQRNPSKATNLTHLYIGTPSTLETCFRVSLAPKTDANIMLIGSDDEMRMGILLSSVRCFLRNPGAEVVIIADAADELYEPYEAYWERLSNERVKIITDFSSICREISQIKDDIKAGIRKELLLLALGFDSLWEEMRLVPPQPQPSQSSPLTGLDSMLSQLDSMMAGLDAELDAELDAQFDSGSDAASMQPDHRQDATYDARDDFNEIVLRGNRYGYHVFLTFASAKALKRVRTIQPENFEHKIAFKMSMDDAMAYLGSSRYMAGVDDISAVYNDGSSTAKLFRPYLLPPMKKER